MDDFVTQINEVSALAEPARRALYDYVAAQPDAVSRDEAAAGTGLPRHTAKFHLDKLVTQGLLSTEQRRLGTRRGPGAGRPSKLYRRSARQIELSLPARRYGLAASILAAAVDDALTRGAALPEAVARAADTAGRRAVRTAAGEPPDAVLAGMGYEPRARESDLVLANCPFHRLVSEHPALTCEMNLHLVAAVLDEAGADGLTAALDPGPGRCCVLVRGE